jgi:ribosome-associated protein
MDKQESQAETEASPANPQIQVAVDAALNRKAEELMVLDLAAISDFTDHFLICNGTNERQVQAIADHVTRQLREQGLKPLHVEGLRHGRWVLLDYGADMVIHIFLGETREFYALERLWADAPDVTSRFVD